MICNNCGAQLPDGTAFCTTCGAPQSGTPQGGMQQGGAQPMQMGYGQQPMYGMPVVQKPSSGLAIASLVLGIVGLLFSCCIPYLPFLCSLAGCILGIISLAKKMGGKGMAIAGLICSIIALIPAIIVVVAGAGLLSMVATMY